MLYSRYIRIVEKFSLFLLQVIHRMISQCLKYSFIYFGQIMKLIISDIITPSISRSISPEGRVKSRFHRCFWKSFLQRRAKCTQNYLPVGSL